MLQYQFTQLCRDGEQICMNESLYNHGLEEHTHDFLEITYIKKGKGICTQNGVSSGLSGGDLVMVAQNDIHQFEPCSNDFSWTNCLFLPQAIAPDLQDSCSLAELFAAFSLRQPAPENSKTIHLKNRSGEFQYLLKDMLYEYYNCRTGYHDILRSQLTALIQKIARSQWETAKDKGQLTGGELAGLVQGFFSHSSSYARISLESIAQKAYISPKYFSYLFKKKVGVRLSDFIRDIRLERAAEMLEHTHANISEIMAYVGYQDSKFFYKIFKEKYGMTPASYKRLHDGSAVSGRCPDTVPKNEPCSQSFSG